MDPMPTQTEVTEEECLRIAREMIMMRRMEIESDPLYVMRKIRGFLHLYDGEVCTINEISKRMNVFIWEWMSCCLLTFT